MRRAAADCKPRARDDKRMRETPDAQNISGSAGGETSRTRRRLLLWTAAAVCGSIAATLAGAAARFLRPRADGSGAEASREGGWLAVGPLSEFAGEQPVAGAVRVSRRAGWSVKEQRQAVFVLPHEGHRVVSAACPHEGCEVEWDAAARSFLCPCHDSSFDARGARTSGPAERGLAPLLSRVTAGVLEVKYQDGDAAPTVQG